MPVFTENPDYAHPDPLTEREAWKRLRFGTATKFVGQPEHILLRLESKSSIFAGQGRHQDHRHCETGFV